QPGAARAGALPARARQRVPYLLQRRAVHCRGGASAQREARPGARSAAGAAQWPDTARRLRPGEHVSAQPARGRSATSAKSAKLTARDYKSTQRRPLDLRGWREFGYGALVGAVLASLAFVYAGAHAHRGSEASPDAPRPDPHHPVRPDPEGAGAAKPSQKYDFY